MKVSFRLRKPLLGLEVGLENRRTSGENEVLPENFEPDVRSRDQTYSLKYHNGHTASSPDVWFRV
jgi:hypothetical protein